MSRYNNVSLEDFDSFDDTVTSTRRKVINDLNKNEYYMWQWFEDVKWQKNQFNHTTLAFDTNKEIIGLSSCKIFPDKTMKILCHYYIFKNKRLKYRSISQTDFIPHHVQFGISNQLKGVWYTVHCFDKRHERLKKSIINGINGGGISLRYQPYVNSFKYRGKITYNHVEQDLFYYSLVDIGDL